MTLFDNAQRHVLAAVASLALAKEEYIDSDLPRGTKLARLSARGTKLARLSALDSKIAVLRGVQLDAGPWREDGVL